MVVRARQLEYKEFLHSKRFAFDSLRTPPRVHRQGEGRPRCDVSAGLQVFHEISSLSFFCGRAYMRFLARFPAIAGLSVGSLLVGSGWMGLVTVNHPLQSDIGSPG